MRDFNSWPFGHKQVSIIADDQVSIIAELSLGWLYENEFNNITKHISFEH